MKRPAQTLLELLEGLEQGTVDDLYFLIATDQVYVDLSQAPLAQPEQVQVFVDREQAEAYAILRQSSVQLFPKRQGPRAAAQVEPFYWELERMTTPRHGDRPWEIVHLDHTELDIVLVSSHTGRCLGKPWATFMTDAYSRRLLVVYLTFDPPSYRSGMMALRECVWRYARL